MTAKTKLYYKQLKPLTIAELLIKYLELEGVTKIFGIPGRANEYMLDALTEDSNQIEYIICRQETGAAYIADGLSRVTGGLGVVLVTSGPGATNALSGSMNAQAGHSALLTITGEIAEKFFGMGYLQEGIDSNLDINNIYQNAVRYSAVVTSTANFQTLISQALRDALSLPRRATHISLPTDIAAETLSSINFPTSPENYRAIPKVTDTKGVRDIFKRLMKAKFPMLFIGNGCRFALRDEELLKRFIKFADKFAIPVMTSANGKGLFPETHLMSFRNYGIANCQWPQHYLAAMNPNYDAMLVLGSSLGQLATNSWSPALVPNNHGPFMQVDIDQAVIGRVYPVQIGVVAEISEVIRQLCDLGDAQKPDEAAVAARRNFITNIKENFSPFADPDAMNSDKTPIHPAAMMKIVSDGLPDGGHIFVDAGNCVGWCMAYTTINPPKQIHSSLAMGPMGFGVGAVIGGKMGAPNATCVGVVGDGAFMMHGNEVSTAAAHKVGAIWVVLFDNDLGMVSQGMNYDFNSDKWTNYYSLGNPDLAKFSESLGADAYNVKSPDEMRTAYATAIRKAEQDHKPQVIVVHIDRTAIPPYYPPKPPKVAKASKK